MGEGLPATEQLALLPCELVNDCVPAVDVESRRSAMVCATGGGIDG